MCWSRDGCKTGLRHSGDRLTLEWRWVCRHQRMAWPWGGLLPYILTKMSEYKILAGVEIVSFCRRLATYRVEITRNYNQTFNLVFLILCLCLGVEIPEINEIAVEITPCWSGDASVVCK